MIVKKKNKSYVYRPERRGGKVIKRYVGPLNDLLPSLIHKQDQLRRSVEHKSASYRRKIHQRVTAINAMQHFHQYRLNQAIERYPEYPFDVSPPLADEEKHLLSDLSSRASNGSRSAMDHLKDWFNCHPQSIDAVGCVNGFMRDAVVDILAEGNPAAAEMLSRAIEQQRKHLLEMTDSPLAEVAANHLVTAWLGVALSLARSAAGAYINSQAKGDEALATAQRNLSEAVALFDRLASPRG